MYSGLVYSDKLYGFKTMAILGKTGPCQIIAIRKT